MCLKEIGVSVQNMTLILGLKAIGVGVVVGGMCMGIFRLILNEMFIWAPRITNNVATDVIWIC